MPGVQRLNVLVVDRDEDSAAHLKGFLAEEGFRASSVKDTATAVDEVKRGRYQMVLQALELPATGDGLELLSRLRAIDSDLCVIATTSDPTVEAAVAAMKGQAFDYLRKPLDLHALRRVLTEAMRAHGLMVGLDEKLNGEIGRRIRERRGAGGLTLKQLSNRTGLSVSLISQIELGKSAASLSTLSKLATALDVRMTAFFDSL